MRDPMADFTPERWEKVKKVLSGESDTSISLAGAARAAGVPPSSIRKWINRSQEQRPEDDPLIHEIAEFAAGVDELQAGRLEDKAWERAMHGWDEPVFAGGEQVGSRRKFDSKLLLRLLQVRDRRFVNEQRVTTRFDESDAAEIMQRLIAGQRVAEARLEAKDQAIDVEEKDDGVYR